MFDKYIYRGHARIHERRMKKRLDLCYRCFVASLAFFVFAAVYAYDLSGLMLEQGRMRHELCWTSTDPLRCVDPTYVPQYREGTVIPILRMPNSGV